MKVYRVLTFQLLILKPLGETLLQCWLNLVKSVRSLTLDVEKQKAVVSFVALSALMSVSC